MLAKDDGSVDIRSQLGSEGGAVLTSSSSVEYSFELQGSELSVYTRYLVEGLETGDADQDRDSFISIGELHEYAKRKVQEAVPGMKPEIYPSKEGYNIKLARVPSTDPALRYRREIQRRAYLKEITFARRTFIDRIQTWLSMPLPDDVHISSTRRKTLEVFRQQLGLSPEAALKIRDEALQPYRAFYQNLESYEQEVTNYLKREKPLKDSTRRILKELQHALQISDNEAAAAEQRLSEKVKFSPYLSMQALQGVANSKLSSRLTYTFSGILIILTSVYLIQLFQARQQSIEPSVNLPEKTTASITPLPSASGPSPSTEPSEPNTSFDMQASVDSYYQDGSNQYKMGSESSKQGDSATARRYYLSAIQAFNQAIALKQPEPQSKDAYLYVSRGSAYLNSDDKLRAFQDYTTAINLQPDNTLLAQAYEWRGDACLGLFNRKGAIDNYEEAINLYVMQSMALDRSRVQNKLQKLKSK